MIVWIDIENGITPHTCVEHFMITNNMECQCVQQRSLRAGPYSLPSGGDNWHDPDRRSTPKSYTATSKADAKHQMIIIYELKELMIRNRSRRCCRCVVCLLMDVHWDDHEQHQLSLERCL
eukprot:662472_1